MFHGMLSGVRKAFIYKGFRFKMCNYMSKCVAIVLSKNCVFCVRILHEYFTKAVSFICAVNRLFKTGQIGKTGQTAQKPCTAAFPSKVHRSTRNSQVPTQRMETRL